MKEHLHFYLSTPTGLIISINFILFIYTTCFSGSLFLPSSPSLIQLGARDLVHISKGEYWRFVTPLFLHGGLIHFLVNNFALKIVGPIVERTSGYVFFVLLYLMTGLGSNLFASMFSPSIGVGASGALFGLLGFMLVFELIYNFKFSSEISSAEKPDKPLKKFIYLYPFLFTILLNFMIAESINLTIHVTEYGNFGIDNAAHAGGLVCGVILGFLYLLGRENRLLKTNTVLLTISSLLFGVVLLYGYKHVSSEEHAVSLLQSKADAASEPQEDYFYTSQALSIKPYDSSLLFRKGKLLIFNRELRKALSTFALVPLTQTSVDKFDSLALELYEKGHLRESRVLRKWLTLRYKNEEDSSIKDI